MRLLHTSDWHLGLSEHNLDRRPDHDRVLAQIRDIARAERVDAILHTGDLFDKDYPGIDVLKYAWQQLEELEAIAPVVVLCGNHDSPKLFELMGLILKNRLRVHFMDFGTLERGSAGVLRIGTVDGEQIVVGAIPFVRHANAVRSFIEEGTQRSTLIYADFVGRIETRVGEWINAGYDPRRDVRIFAAHLLVADATLSGSEYAFYVERDFATLSQRIPVADYVAFGHIHKPQEIPNVKHGRYAGSPLPIDFGEKDDQKCVYLVTGKPGRELSITPIALDVGRRLVDIRGTLDEIAAHREDWAGAIARVTVALDRPVTELEARVRQMLAGTRVVSVTPWYRNVELKAVVAAVGGPEPTVPELFAEFLATNPQFPDHPRLQRYFESLLDQVHREEEQIRLSDLDEALE